MTTKTVGVRIPVDETFSENMEKATICFYEAFEKLTTDYVQFVRDNYDVLTKVRAQMRNTKADRNSPILQLEDGTENRAAGYTTELISFVAISVIHGKWIACSRDGDNRLFCVDHDAGQDGHDHWYRVKTSELPTLLSAAEAGEILETLKRYVKSLHTMCALARLDVEKIGEIIKTIS